MVTAKRKAKYKLIPERKQNKIYNIVLFKMYGTYPGYPILYLALFTQGVEQRDVEAVATYWFKILRGKINNPKTLELLQLSVPEEYAERRQKPVLLVVLRARTKLLKCAPLTHALPTLNTLSQEIDLLNCTLNDFTRATYFTCTHFVI